MTDITNSLATILELMLSRHGVDLAKVEGTRDDAELILGLFQSPPKAQPKAPEPTVPEGYYMIETQDGKRLSPMTQFEYDGWVNGNHIRYSGYEVRPKRDFGAVGFYDPKTRAKTREGWVVVKNGCNALPGGTWGKTQNDTLMMIDCLLAVDEDPTKFWHMLRAIQRGTGKLS